MTEPEPEPESRPEDTQTEHEEPIEEGETVDPVDAVDPTPTTGSRAGAPAVTMFSSATESAGKSAVALGLATIAADRGERVGYMKPVGTRLESVVGKTRDQDPMLARELLDLDTEIHDMEPVVYSPTFVKEAIRGRQDPTELRDRVREAFGTVAEGVDRVVVEGGGTVTTGGVVGLTDPQVAALLDARTVLVAGYEDPRELDDVLAAAEDVGDRLDGLLFNAVGDDVFDDLEADAVPFLERRGYDVHGALPYDRRLAGITVTDLAAELGAETLADPPEDAYVERFLVGAMGAESALRHFRRTRDAAVVTGGDRPDIHTAAIEAGGVRCLVLTGGHRPSGAVLGKAADRGTAVLLVGGDTRSTVDRAEDVVRSGRVRDRQTVERVRNLLEEHADIDALLNGR
jgi:BioD-like phosphotransacetylase family protein